MVLLGLHLLSPDQDDLQKQVRVVNYLKAVRLLSNEGYSGNCKVSFVKRGVLTVGNLYIFWILYDIFRKIFPATLLGSMYIQVKLGQTLVYPWCRLKRTIY